MAACGFPNQDFFYYGEDTDYAFRLADQGFKSYIVPRCVVEHAGGGFMAPVAAAGLGQLALLLHVPQPADAGAHVRRPARAAQAPGLPDPDPDGPLQAPPDGIRRGNFGACRLALRGAADAFLGRMGKRVAPGATG